MNRSIRSVLTLFISLLCLLFVQSKSFATVVYIGDYLVDKVADELKNAKLEHVDIAPLIIEPDRLAALSNIPEWWPEALQVVNSYQLDAVIISLGMNDMTLRESKFPSANSLDMAVTTILDNVRAITPAAVFWVIPHIAAADKNHYVVQRNAIVKAVNRAQSSGNYEGFFVVDLDFWASQNDLELVDLLTANKEGFTSRGAAICADIVVETVNSYTAP